MIVVRRLGIVLQRLVLKGLQQILHITLQIKESSVLGAPPFRAFCGGWAGSAHADAFGFGRPAILRFENAARLEQAHLVRPAIEVVGQHIEHAGHQRAPHHRRFFALRIGQLDHRARRKCFGILVRNECQRHRFVVAERQQRSSKLVVFLRIRRFHHCPGIRRQRIGEFVVAVQARDLFDQIDLAFHVQTPARNVDGEIRVAAPLRHQLKTQLLQNAENFVGLELLSENAVHFRKMQGHGSQIHLAGHRVDRAAVQFASG